eukprot:s1854_g6.t1
MRAYGLRHLRLHRYCSTSTSKTRCRDRQMRSPSRCRSRLKKTMRRMSSTASRSFKLASSWMTASSGIWLPK